MEKSYLEILSLKKRVSTDLEIASSSVRVAFSNAQKECFHAEKLGEAEKKLAQRKARLKLATILQIVAKDLKK